MPLTDCCVDTRRLSRDQETLEAGLLVIDVDILADCPSETLTVWPVARIGPSKKCYVTKMKNHFSNTLIIMYIKSDIVKGVNGEHLKIM